MIPRWLGAFAAALVALGVAGLSGSSWLYGGRVDRLFTAEERAAQRELYGTSRGIRSDEWAVETPQARAQQLAGFPLVNMNEGIGELQRNTYDIPVLDWGLPFRPFSWPYFLGSRWSHGLRWFLRDAVILLGVYALLAAFVEEKRTAAAAALAIFFSSSFVWWRSTVMLGFIGLLCLTGGVAARAVRTRAPAWFLLTAYCAACSFCVFYPPVWAPMLWVVCAAILDIAWRRRSLGSGALLIGLVAAGAVVGVLYQLPYLSLIADTAYPGQRIAHSGEFPVARLVEIVWPSLTVAAPVNCGVDRYLGLAATNVCEASTLEVLPVAVLPAMALASARVRRAFSNVLRTSPVSVLAFAVLGAWLFAPLPDWFGSLTLLRWSPAARVWIPFCMSAALLVTLLIASLHADPQPEVLRWRGLVAIAVVAACALAARRHIRLELVADCYARAWIPPILLAALALSGGAVLAGTPRGATLLLAGWAGSVALANHRVDPLIRSQQLFSNGSGHEAVERALALNLGRILDYSTHPGAQLAAFGWPMLGGVQNSPDLALFRFLGPESPGLSEEVYNRYAHYSFELPPGRSRILDGDNIRVAIHPCSRRLSALSVNHLLMDADSTPDAACAVEWMAQPAGELWLWSRRTPVCAVGVARGSPASALDFDYACPSEARVNAGVSAFSIEVPPDPARSWAVALNSAVIAGVDCVGATARFLDAHLVVHPEGGGTSTCRARYLDSGTALRRLLKK